jgi:hypothetical protein
MDAALFKMRYRAPEVLRPWTPMIACPGQDIGYFLGRKSASVGLRLSVDDEGDGANRPLIGLDSDPARDIVRRLERELAPEELSELRLQIALRHSVEHSPTLATPVERHHEAGLLLGASPPGLS